MFYFNGDELVVKEKFYIYTLNLLFKTMMGAKNWGTFKLVELKTVEQKINIGKM